VVHVPVPLQELVAVTVELAGPSVQKAALQTVLDE
jgi:hypothetical protein